MAVAMLQDMSLCMACKGCQVACKEWNELPAVETVNLGDYENPRDLAPETWTRVRFFETGNGGDPAWRFFKQQCMHCTDAPCVEVCPTDALKHDALGFVSFERDLCNGCGYCGRFCPYDIPRLEVDSVLTGRGKASKCTLCQDRVTNGEEPACAKACPSSAIEFGDREQLIARGRDRVRQLRAQGVADANLYGETEMGGLGVLYVLPEPPATYGLPRNPEAALATASLWKGLVQPAGLGALALGAVGLAVNYAVYARRTRGAGQPAGVTAAEAEGAAERPHRASEEEAQP